VWDVGDEPTSEVLVEFHRRMAAGAPAAEALRQAQIAALRSPRAEMRAPAAWAPFIYTGP
jgi:CHAT domain-containing protein